MPAECRALTIVLNSADDAGGAVARFGREETDRVIAPVITETALGQLAIVNESRGREEVRPPSHRGG